MTETQNDKDYGKRLASQKGWDALYRTSLIPKYSIMTVGI